METKANDFIQELTQKMKAKEDTLRAEELQKQREAIASALLIEATNTKFNEIKELVKSSAGNYADIITNSKTGDTVTVYVSSDASNKEDKERQFVEVLFYPKGHDPKKFGHNTPLIEFEALPKEGKLRVSKRITLRPEPAEVIDEENISAIQPSHVESFLQNFMREVILLNK